MFLKDYINNYILYIERLGRSKKTILNTEVILRKVVLPTLGEKKLEDLKITDGSYILFEGNKLGKYTGQRAIIVFRGLLKYLHDDGVSLPVHYTDYKVPHIADKVVEYLTEEERDILREHINLKNKEGLRLRAMFEVALRTGLRRSELTSIRISDIDFINHEVNVENGKKPGVWQKVYIYGCEQWISAYLATRKDRSPYLFVTARGEKIGENLMKGIMVKLRKKLQGKIKKHLHWHLIRKTFCTEMLFNKIDINTAKSLSRHASVQTLLRHYAAINEKHSKEEHKRVMSVLN